MLDMTQQILGNKEGLDLLGFVVIKSHSTKFCRGLSSFSRANEDEVLRLWQGLGYYSRARNMLATAKELENNYRGDFPPFYSEIIKLKGIGDYTAAAIASFSFDEQVAVVDGNVFRVLSRLFDVETPIDSSVGKSRSIKSCRSIYDFH